MRRIRDTSRGVSLFAFLRPLLMNCRLPCRLVSEPNLTRAAVWASSSAEKAEVLLDSWFPPRDPLPDAKSYINDLSSPNENTCPFVSVSNEEVDEAIKGTSNSSAPGLSGISYKAIKWAFSVEPDAITALVRASIRFGIHHDRWKAALIVPIPKPNKKTYSSPRSHRPIQLLDCVGKIVEKVVAKRLLFDVGKYDLMPFCRLGGRPSASCLDAVSSFEVVGQSFLSS